MKEVPGYSRGPSLVMAVAAAGSASGVNSICTESTMMKQGYKMKLPAFSNGAAICEGGGGGANGSHREQEGKHFYTHVLQHPPVMCLFPIPFQLLSFQHHQLYISPLGFTKNHSDASLMELQHQYFTSWRFVERLKG